MEGKKEKTGNIPKYEQIAADIAYQIVEGTYKEGEKNLCPLLYRKQI